MLNEENLIENDLIIEQIEEQNIINYYLFIENDVINGRGTCKRVDDKVINFEVSEEIYNDFEKYMYKDGEIVLNPNYEKEQELKERERIAKLNLTGADVERGIYQAKGMDFDDIVAMVTQLQPESLDIKALKIELKANHFYRGNPYVNAVGALLGFTSEQLDKFFETNDYTYLISEPSVDNSEGVNEEEPLIDDVTGGDDVNNQEG